MKLLWLIAAIGIGCFLSFCSTLLAYTGGTGIETDPYQIADPNDWQELTNDPNNWDKYFVLTNDLDFDEANLTPLASDTDPNTWDFQGTSFTGDFDGNHHVLRNAVINQPASDFVGLFGCLGSGCRIYNLGVENISVSGRGYVGGLCGYNGYGTITDSYATGSVIGGDSSYYLGGLCGGNGYGTITDSYATAAVTGGDSSSYLGALCGYNLQGTVSDCYATGAVSGQTNSSFLGGLCGYNGYGTITDSYAAGPVTGGDSSMYLGGLCGYNYYNGTITNCYVTNSVTGGNYSFDLGGLCGSNDGSISNCYATNSVTGGNDSYDLGGLCGVNYGTIYDCYWNRDTVALSTSSGGWVLSDTQMKQAASFLGWNNGEWTIDEGNDYPRLAWENALGSPIMTDYPARTYSGDGSENNPFQFNKPADLVCLGLRVPDHNSYFILTDNIEMAEISDYRPPQSFGGNFDGQGYVISHLTVDASLIGNSSQLGLFGRMNTDSVVANLGLVQVGISGGDYSKNLGGLCGYLDHGSINNCYVTGSVTGGDYSSCLGGLCGNNRSTISNCWATGTVSGVDNSYYLGGLCGANDGSISDCYASGSVTGGDNPYYLGGLCGMNYYGTISDCYATSNVIGGGSSSYLGGLCGWNAYNSLISGCYALGMVTAGETSFFLGGLCGYNYQSTISGCYASGTVCSGNSSGHLGGLCGLNANGTISNGYATGSVTGGNDSYYLGGLCGWNWEGTISGCYAMETVTGEIGSFSLGGLCGTSSRGTINDCYTTGTVTGGDNSDLLGGLVGYNDQGKVIRCYSTAKPTGTADVGGLCGGKTTGGDYEDTGNFWDTDTSEILTSEMGTGKTTTEMQTLATFTTAAWDFVDTWSICQGTNYSRLQWQIPAQDFVCPDGVCTEDLAYFIQWWLHEDCGSSNDCDGSDLNTDGQVDLEDLSLFAAHWLAGQ